MISSVMSTFDPCPIHTSVSWKWFVSLILGFVFWNSIFQQIFLVNFGGLSSAFFVKSSEIFKQFNGGSLLLISLYLFFIVVGVSGLIPWSFALSSHLSVTLSLSLPLWISGVVKTFIENNEEVVAHLLPLGSPVLLHPFLVLVESVSLIIRPFTLGVRLMANVMSGHLILSLVGSGILHPVTLIPSVFVESVFVGFELGITLVQSYVFVTLLSLYWDE